MITAAGIGAGRVVSLLTPHIITSCNARCHSRHSRGQALVEFALVMPLLAFTFLGFAELGRAYFTAFGWQRGADVLAQSAAVRVVQDPDWRPSWNVMAAEEQARAGCGDADVTFPDGTQPGGRVEVTWTCSYGALLFNGLTLPATEVASVAVIPVVP